MESHMVDILSPEECVEIVTEYFQENFKNFSPVDKGHYTGWWWVKYIDKVSPMRVEFDGDYGGHFFVYLYIDNKRLGLWQYDPSVTSFEKSTRENILYQLECLKRFLS